MKFGFGFYNCWRSKYRAGGIPLVDIMLFPVFDFQGGFTLLFGFLGFRLSVYVKYGKGIVNFSGGFKDWKEHKGMRKIAVGESFNK